MTFWSPNAQHTKSVKIMQAHSPCADFKATPQVHLHKRSIMPSTGEMMRSPKSTVSSTSTSSTSSPGTFKCRIRTLGTIMAGAIVALFLIYEYRLSSLLQMCAQASTMNFPDPLRVQLELFSRQQRQSMDSWKRRSSDGLRRHVKSPQQSVDLFDQQDPATVIGSDELPGYTGWSRSPHTLAHYFHRQNEHQHSQITTVVKSTPFQTTVTCMGHDLCTEGGSLFYLRAYGPALLTGTVHDYRNGTYTFTVIPHDAGVYKLEVVLTFSHPPSFDQLPVTIAGSQSENSYEGYMLPTFPIQFRVVSGENDDESTTRQLQSLPRCRASDLLETSKDSPLHQGRWVVKNKQRFLPSNEFRIRDGLENVERISLKGYKTSENSVGFEMEYNYTNCTVDPLNALLNRNRWILTMEKSKRVVDGKNSRLHLLFFGDSNIRNQHNFVRDYFAKPTRSLNGRLQLTYVEVMKFWPLTWESSRQKFLEVYENNPHDHFVVIYNLGLHEISNRCSLFGQKAGRFNATHPPGPCLPPYREDVATMTDLVLSKPALVRIWQSTTAGWPKWGVFGLAWPQNRGQYFPLATDMCGHLNDVAKEIVEEKNVKIMDTYWMALPRPDHREVVDKDTSRTSYKLVHMGPEVYLQLMRQILSIVLEALEEGEANGTYL